MEIRIRKSKRQNKELTKEQVSFAHACIQKYIEANADTYCSYEGLLAAQGMGCDVYKTKTTISAIVWFRG